MIERVETVVAEEGLTPDVAAVCEEVHPDVMVEPAEVSQEDDETLVLDKALLLLRGINRSGWHKMLAVIGEEKKTQIPPNFKKMTKNNSRADALLRLKTTVSIVARARELALNSQAK